MGKVLRKILTFVLLGVFLFSSVKILLILKTYRDSKIVYDEAVESFVRPAALPKPAASAGAGAGTAAPASGGAESSAPAAQAQPPEEAEELRYGVYAPIAVDFEHTPAAPCNHASAEPSPARRRTDRRACTERTGLRHR